MPIRSSRRLDNLGCIRVNRSDVDFTPTSNLVESRPPAGTELPQDYQQAFAHLRTSDAYFDHRMQSYLSVQLSMHSGETFDKCSGLPIEPEVEASKLLALEKMLGLENNLLLEHFHHLQGSVLTPELPPNVMDILYHGRTT